MVQIIDMLTALLLCPLLLFNGTEGCECMCSEGGDEAVISSIMIPN